MLIDIREAYFLSLKVTIFDALFRSFIQVPSKMFPQILVEYRHPLPDLSLPPTTHQWEVNWLIEGYRLKVNDLRHRKIFYRKIKQKKTVILDKKAGQKPMKF